MSSWTQRMQRAVVTCGLHSYPTHSYHRLEKVKFGIRLDEVCKNDIPGPLLVLILKLNKEAPMRKNIFRAPGNQGSMKKLIHFLQTGRLINVDNFSVYTIASVLKKFLRKLPGGIFSHNGEMELFSIIDIDDVQVQQERIHNLLMTLPIYTQHLLVLLFGTFRVIASNSERAGTGMTSEAIGVSVAPSFFQSCVSDGKTARMEDVMRFKVATRIMKQMIEQFAAYNLFGRENYEYYARVTGRVLRVEDEWICSFRYPPPPRVQLSLETEKTWLQCECERWGLSKFTDDEQKLMSSLPNRHNCFTLHVHWIQLEFLFSQWNNSDCNVQFNVDLYQEESYSTPELLTNHVGNSAISVFTCIPEHSLLESCARLSVSLEGPGIFAQTQSSCSSSHSSRSNSHHMTMDELRAVNRYAESTKSLSYLPQVHERQRQRMRTRSEWFLGARGGSLELSPENLRTPTGVGNIGLSLSAESVHHSKRPSRRGSSRHPHRSSSRRNKENGSRSGSFRNNNNSNCKDDGGRIRKQRAVSFEQPTLHQKWCDFPLMNNIKTNKNQEQNQLNKLTNNDIDISEDISMIDITTTTTTTTPTSILHHHYKPPRL